MSAEKIINDFKNNNFKPIYWLEGEEPYFIDKVVEYAENSILTLSESDFNLSVFYGKDADWTTVVNACKRHPMFGNKQVVILKEAQQMKDVEKNFEAYVDNPLATTIFIISYKDKKVDARTKFSKTLKAKGEILSTKKMYDSKLPEWITQLTLSKGLSINQKANAILIDHIGNDLSRIENEIDKLLVNLSGRKTITEDDIEKYIGVSKEYNVFEMQDAIGKKNFAKAIRIIQYFEKNPKAGPIQMILPALYGFFSKVYIVFSVASSDERTVAAATGINPFFIKDYMLAANNYKYEGVEKALLLLHQYNLKSLGVNNASSNDADLMKELVIKMMM
jgi:DNA polymerase III subunit delta